MNQHVQTAHDAAEQAAADVVAIKWVLDLVRADEGLVEAGETTLRVLSHLRRARISDSLDLRAIEWARTISAARADGVPVTFSVDWTGPQQ
jgi:hypothetical protein